MKKEIISEFQSKRLVYNHLIYTDITDLFIGAQTHDVFELLYIKNGDITYHIEGKKYLVKKNGLIITRPGYSHIISINSSDIYERYDFLFENRIVKDSILNKLPDEMDVINLNEYPQISEIFNKTDYYCKYFKEDELKNILANLVEEIFYNIIIVAEKFPKNQLNGNFSANPTIAAAIEYIDNHLSNSINLDDICRELFVSKSYLHQLFMRHMQTSPQKYITSKRLLMAQKEIRNLKKPTEIYSYCGFSDYSSFFRAYKKYFGYPPSQELNQKIYRVIEF